jgi:antitoxin component of MazEF toxin-antitoxin module
MLEFKAVPKKWGNSIGITLPNKIVEEGDIKAKKEIEVFIVEKKVNLKKIFGSLKLEQPTQKIKDEMRTGWG